MARDDTERRLVIGGAAETEAYLDELRAEAAARQEECARQEVDALARLSGQLRTQLVHMHCARM